MKKSLMIILAMLLVVLAGTSVLHAEDTLIHDEITAEVSVSEPAEEFVKEEAAEEAPAESWNEPEAVESVQEEEIVEIEAEAIEETTDEIKAETDSEADADAEISDETAADEDGNEDEKKDAVMESAEDGEAEAEPSEGETEEEKTDEEPAAKEVTEPADEEKEEDGETEDEISDEESAEMLIDDEETGEEEAEVVKENVVVTIIGAHVMIGYDGESHSASGYEVSISSANYTEADFRFTGKASAEQTEVGIAYMGLSADQFENLNEDFDRVTFIVTDGYVKINPVNVVVTIAGKQSTVDFDGEFHSVEGYDIVAIRCDNGSDKCPYGSDDFDFSGNASAEGSEAGVYYMGLSADDFTNLNSRVGSVIFDVTDGCLVIVDNGIEMPAEEETEEPAEGEVTGETEITEPTDEEPAEEPVEEEIADEEFEGEVSSDEKTEEPVTEEPGEEEIAVEETETIVLSADTVIRSAADGESEIVLTAAGDETVKVLFIENGWMLVELADGTLGYVAIEAESADDANEESEIGQSIFVGADINIRVDADGMSEILFTTVEDLTELVILEVTDEWIKVQLPDGTVGYIYSADIEAEDEDEDIVVIPSLEKKVTIFTSRRTQMAPGEDIHLTSVLEGFEDCTAIKYQWECDKGDGFKAVEGGNGASYTYTTTAESLSWSWRLIVYYK